MKNFFSITILVMSITFLCSCNQANKKNVQVAEGTEACCEKSTKSCCDSTAIVQSEVTTVVYFHNERRCATCLAVEEVAQEVVATMDSTKVVFISCEIGNEKSAELEKDLKISGQTFLVITKDKTIDLTNSAFLNARVNPEQFKSELLTALKTE